MPVRDVASPFPVIDRDPHFVRVVRYFRPSDYAAWVAGTAIAPGLLLGMEKMNPSGAAGNIRSPLKLAAFLGAIGGFLYAYQRSSLRFWGCTENAAEVEKDYAEMTQRIKEGKPLYGESQMSPYLQGVAARNSRYGQLKFSAIPWFNVVNHPYHGVDTSKYEEAAKGN
ncbi:NADH-ubiquinone oxidoreductase complex I, 21 kDa subunit-domain-containing protein [Endogone sp. FLAS-F59071]|nr:NADH-ubiquinone oxidoreductase complex I, 21 kDa subunit-domain-containing protein [Endogone sp. FLAS-F59071]|eukprot:RUS14920.1 NADH-ubiquinone oxidoreductase complex I, 21 kDa subunit-domain-containing protein [Endogone sp. FLAS-F59071]